MSPKKFPGLVPRSPRRAWGAVGDLCGTATHCSPLLGSKQGMNCLVPRCTSTVTQPLTRADRSGRWGMEKEEGAFPLGSVGVTEGKSSGNRALEWGSEGLHQRAGLWLRVGQGKSAEPAEESCSGSLHFSKHRVEEVRGDCGCFCQLELLHFFWIHSYSGRKKKVQL